MSKETAHDVVTPEYLQSWIDRANSAEAQLAEQENEWYQRYREQANYWEERTRMIRKQLDTLCTMIAKGESIKPPTIIVKQALGKMMGRVEKQYQDLDTGEFHWTDAYVEELTENLLRTHIDREKLKKQLDKVRGLLDEWEEDESTYSAPYSHCRNGNQCAAELKQALENE